MSEIPPMVDAETRGRDVLTQYTPREASEPRWLFDYEHLYWSIKAALMGGYITEAESKTWKIIVPDGAKPFMNTEGIESTMAFVTGFITKIPATSNFGTDDVRVMRLCERDCHMLINFFWANMKVFEVTPVKASAVVYIIMDAIESNYRKSINAKALQLMLASEQVRTVTTEQQKKGILSKLPFL